MKIRVIQLMNNFFRDENKSTADRERALGTYCTFGYFDALKIEEGKSFPDTEKSVIWKNIEQVAVNTLDGTCSRRNLVCITDEEDKDRAFWESAKSLPYLFISLIRIRHDANDMDIMYQVLEEIRKDNEVMTYFSYNHSELVIAKLANNYAKGMEFVLSMRKKLVSLNIHSIFSVREDAIKIETEIQKTIDNEEVAVQLRMMIKNDQKTVAFLQSLWDIIYEDKIEKGEQKKEENFDKYYTLGSNDMLVRIEQVETHKLLPCYKMGNLLTHTNPQFDEAVYNIQTEILVKGDNDQHGKSVDSGEVREVKAAVQ